MVIAGLPFALNTFGYSGQGHEAIAEFAHTHLNPKVLEIVDGMLATDSFIAAIKIKIADPLAPPSVKSLPEDDLGKLAVWADDIKFAKRHMRSTPLLGDAETIAFNLNFKSNGDWHFLNLPLATEAFSEKSLFNPDANNVVDVLVGAIHVLEGQPSGYQFQDSKGEIIDFTQNQALRLIVHLVGDIHQPLHVGTGFYKLPSANGQTTLTLDTNDDSILVTDPSAVISENTKLPNDSGGNAVYPSSLELHAIWDDVLVQIFAGGTKNSHVLAQKMSKNVSDVQVYLNKDDKCAVIDYHNWPALWATDSVHEAKEIYKGITYQSVDFKPNGTIAKIHVTLPETYRVDQAGRVEAQLEKAGAHLALLLNSIHWKIQ